MKKLVSILLVIFTLCSFSLTAMAKDVEFVPSITNKGAPELLVTIDEDGKQVIGYLKDSNSEVIAIEYKDHIVITSVSDADDSTEIPKDAKDTLKKVYEDLSKPNTKLSDLCPDLTDLVKSDLSKDKTADDLVIRDLFDITALCDSLKTKLPVDGTVVDLSFKVGIDADTFITAMVYVNGAWKLVPTVNNGDGTITCTFEDICPVAFLVPADASCNGVIADDATDSNVTIVTGKDNVANIILWGSIMAVSFTLVIALCVVSRRKKN